MAESSAPTILVIFGVTGDLSKRYLLPSLYHLFKQDLLPEKFEIVGLSRREISLDDVFSELEASDEQLDPAVIQKMRQQCRTFQLDMDDPQAYNGLREKLDAIEEEQGLCMNRLYYLAIPPAAYLKTIGALGSAGLNQSCQHGEAMTRLLVEKPFGHDLASAETLIKDTGEVFGEEQLFRIDHYLAKETAQNILTFRFENPLFEAVWSNKYVTSIDIVASEKIGIEGRANFYEEQGALRDFIQNHLLQLLAIVTMDKPARMDSEAVHAAKLRLLEAVAPISSAQVATQTKRGQYEGYKDEVGNAGSHVETYASISTRIDTDRWHNVPVTVRTGKAMAEKHTTITLTFADDSTAGTNLLKFRIQPNEGIQLDLTAKKPGYDQELQDVAMDFSYHQNFDGAEPSAYERVLIDAIRGDRTLFASSEEVLAAWRIVDDVIHAWSAGDDGLATYKPGSPIDTL